MASGASSRSEYCPFEPGEEEAARAYLDQPSELSDLVVSKEELRPRVFRALFIPVLLRLSAVGVVTMLGVLLLYDDAWDIAWMAGGGVVLTAVVLGLLARIFIRGRGPLIVSGTRGTISLGDERIAVFDELGVPRLVPNQGKREPESGTDSSEAPMIVMQRRVGNPLVLFDSTVPVAVLRRLPELADRINALLAEHDQRRAVERWLTAREAELAKGPAYRSEALDD